MAGTARRNSTLALTATLSLAVLASGCSTGNLATLPGPKRGTKVKPHARLEMVQERAEGELHMGDAPTIARTVVSRGYDLGGRTTVEVGEPVVSIRNHTSRAKVVAAVARRDFGVRCVAKKRAGIGTNEPRACLDVPYSKLAARTGDELFVPGVVAGRGIEDPVYLIAVNVEGGVLYILADKFGRILEDQNVAWRKGNTTVTDAVGLPLSFGILDIPLPTTDPLFEYKEADTIREGPSRLNYDLVYRGTKNGASGEMLEMTYREYSPFSGDIPIYTLDILFDSAKRELEFKEFRIKVFEADDTEITFSVEDDGSYGSLG